MELKLEESTTGAHFRTDSVTIGVPKGGIPARNENIFDIRPTTTKIAKGTK